MDKALREAKLYGDALVYDPKTGFVRVHLSVWLRAYGAASPPVDDQGTPLPAPEGRRS